MYKGCQNWKMFVHKIFVEPLERAKVPEKII